MYELKFDTWTAITKIEKSFLLSSIEGKVTIDY